MKVFLDENVPHKLRTVFLQDGHFVETVKSMKWLGKKNGELMGLIVLKGFDVFITRDRNLKHQQNLKSFDVVIIEIISKSSEAVDLIPLAEKVNKLLKSKLKKGIYQVS